MANKKKLVRKAMINDKKQKLKDIPICICEMGGEIGGEMGAEIRQNLQGRGWLATIDHDDGGTQMGSEQAIKLLKYWSDEKE